MLYNEHETCNEANIETVSITTTATMAAKGSTAKERATQYFQSLAPGEPNPGESTEAYAAIDELAFALSRTPTFHPRPVKIVAIGAGFSGLAIARAVHAGQLPNASVTVFEKNGGVGGTWYENRYPG